MGTQSVAEMAATEPRERLAAFVRELVAALPLARQRANALVYARGLIEHGGRKSLQPTLFRLGASALLGDVERQLEHHVTGRYSARHRHPTA